MTVRAAIAAGLAAVTLAACGGGGTTAPAEPGTSGDPAPVVLRAATLRPGQPLPAVSGPTLLTLTGGISATPTGTIPLDRRMLGQLAQVQLRTYEPWVKKELEFRGVWLADVLAVAGADSGAAVRITALDDYTVDLSTTDLASGGILLATTDGEGREIPVDEGGPTRIVFRDTGGAGANADQWIWSLRTIDVR